LITLSLFVAACASAPDVFRTQAPDSTSAAPAPAPEQAPPTPDASTGGPSPESSIPTPVNSTRAFTTTAEFRIGPEDILDVLVWKNPELSRTVPVRPDGMISVPLVNDIRAAGLTTVELRQQLTQRLAEFIPSPEVSVIVREVHSVKVSVVGAVRMPGHYEVKSTSTVLDMIARAQGLTEFANRDRIVVHRQNGPTTTQMSFNYSRVAEGRDDNFVVQPGDIIVVP
jgi:polysaccharide export outer membrane protein